MRSLGPWWLPKQAFSYSLLLETKYFSSHPYTHWQINLDRRTLHLTGSPSPGHLLYWVPFPLRAASLSRLRHYPRTRHPFSLYSSSKTLALTTDSSCSSPFVSPRPEIHPRGRSLRSCRPLGWRKLLSISGACRRISGWGRRHQEGHRNPGRFSCSGGGGGKGSMRIGKGGTCTSSCKADRVCTART